MNQLIEIQNQIQQLQKQADQIRAEEFDKTVQEILEKMTAYGITVRDLDGSKGRVRKASAPGTTGTVVTRHAAAKFRGPNGESWSGRGLMPRWLSALVAQGRTRDEFAIKP